MCPPFVSLLVSALFRWPCSISMRLSPRSVAAGLRWPCAGHVAFLFMCLPSLSLVASALFRWPCSISIQFICLPGPSLVVSALFCWPCSISIHLSPRSVTGGSVGHALAMSHFYSFVSQVCHWWRPPFSAGHVAFLFNSFVSQVCHRWCPPFSAGHVAFLFICFPGLSLVVSALFRWPCSISIHLSPRSVAGGVRPFPLAM